jgi:hypothetical protein
VNSVQPRQRNYIKCSSPMRVTALTAPISQKRQSPTIIKPYLIDLISFWKNQHTVFNKMSTYFFVIKGSVELTTIKLKEYHVMYNTSEHKGTPGNNIQRLSKIWRRSNDSLAVLNREVLQFYSFSLNIKVGEKNCLCWQC